LAGGVYDAELQTALHPPVNIKPWIFKVADNPNDNPKPKPKPAAKAKPKRQQAEWKTFVATAYTPFCSEGCIGITKTGIDVSNTTKHNGKQIIAVDPSVIPLGSTVQIRFKSGKIIEATAQDTGAAIKGRRIDYLVATEGEAAEFGRQAIGVRVVSR
jgi:3D (Asp-Asp-Asp) domain-containing protein